MTFQDTETIITLVKTSTTYDSIGVAQITETTRQAYAHLNSIGQKEYWSSTGQHDFKPEAVAEVFRYDYDGEELAEIDGERFQIYRTYIQGDKVDLYLTRRPRETKK